MAGKRVDVNWLGRMTTYENLVVKSRGMAPLFSVGRPGTAPPGFHWREAGEKGGHGGKLVRRKAGNWTVEFPGKLASVKSSHHLPSLYCSVMTFTISGNPLLLSLCCALRHLYIVLSLLHEPSLYSAFTFSSAHAHNTRTITNQI